MLASSLNDMFENLEIHEDCYGVGHFAKVVASELANLPSAKARRKVRRIIKIIPLFTSIKMVFLCNSTKKRQHYFDILVCQNNVAAFSCCCKVL